MTAESLGIIKFIVLTRHSQIVPSTLRTAMGRLR